MFSNLLYEITSTINEKTDFKCAKVNENIFQGFDALNLDLDFKRLFQWYWFSEDFDVGPFIFSAENVLKFEKENNFLKIGLIQIGDCSNGDEIFFRISDLSILYWSHEEAEDCQKDEHSLILTYNRVESLLLNICNSNLIPSDSYSAREYFELSNGR